MEHHQSQTGQATEQPTESGTHPIHQQMINFRIGQRVVYITGIRHPKNSIHVIMDIKTLSCGCVKLNIGVPDSNPGQSLFRCQDHEYSLADKDGYDWYTSNSFRPIQYESASMEILENFKLTEEKADVEIKELEPA